MNRFTLQELQENLETWLGDPQDPANPFAMDTLLQLDEAEFYPHVQRQRLLEFGLPRDFVSREQGGLADSPFDCFCLFSQITGRDPTTAVTLSLTSLGYMPVWVAGDQEQKQRYGARALQGAFFSWGLSEDAHGSDVLANEMQARKVDGGYLLCGQKNLIGNISLAESAAMFVRTREQGGPTGFSLMMFDRQATPVSSYSYLPKVRTLGLRGLDLSGIVLKDAFVPDCNLLGREGQFDRVNHGASTSPAATWIMN